MPAARASSAGELPASLRAEVKEIGERIRALNRQRRGPSVADALLRLHEALAEVFAESCAAVPLIAYAELRGRECARRRLDFCDLCRRGPIGLVHDHCHKQGHGWLRGHVCPSCNGMLAAVDRAPISLPVPIGYADKWVCWRLRCLTCCREALGLPWQPPRGLIERLRGKPGHPCTSLPPL